MVQFLENNSVLVVAGFGEKNLLIHIDDYTLAKYSKCNSEPLTLEYTTNNQKIKYTLKQQQILYGMPIFCIDTIETEPINYEAKKNPMWNSVPITC